MNAASKVVAGLALLSFCSGAATASPERKLRETKCNLRYNNQGIVAGSVPCKAWFGPAGTLERARFYYPKTQSWYDWDVKAKSVDPDKRWAECIRFTFPEGNQWQACTVPSPYQLNIRNYPLS